MPSQTTTARRFSRRSFLSAAGAAVVAGASPAFAAAREAPGEDYRVQNGRIKQSVYGWCFNPMPTEELIAACHRMGIPAMDVGRNYYPELRRRGILFAGLDVIGDWLSEVNVTSPTCIRELDAEYGLNIAGLLFDAAEARLEAG